MCTVPLTFETLLYAQIHSLANNNDVVLVSNFESGVSERLRNLPVRFVSISIPRSPSPLRLARSVIELVRLVRAESPDVIHSVTPLAGLVTQLAALTARGKVVRMHTFTGQVWETASGPRRWSLQSIDWIIGHLAGEVRCDSRSQLAQLEATRLVPRGKGRILGSGSLSGVDYSRFANAIPADRSFLGLDETVIVILFLGRMAADKGISVLVEAFDELHERLSGVHLLLVGPDDERDPIEPPVRERIAGHPAITRLDHIADPSPMVALADIFCLPSRREGFGTVVVEAGAAGLPVVATRATGLVDAVVDQETGLLVNVDDVGEIADALERLVVDPTLRAVLGDNGQRRALEEFDEAHLSALVEADYDVVAHS